MALEHNVGCGQGFVVAFSTAEAPCGATLGTVMLTVFALLESGPSSAPPPGS